MLNWITSLYSDWRSERSTGSDRTTEADSEERSSGTESGERADGTAGEGADAPLSWPDLLEGEEVSKQDVQMELGLQPHEFLVGLIRYSGGHMWQADVVDTTGWSKSTVSRYLDTLESSGLVERVWIGRRKLVGIPGEMPDSVPTPDRSPAEPRSDSWASEADEPA